MTNEQPILLVKPPLIGAGFAACMLTVLNHVRHCEREGLTPVVHIDASCQTRFLDPAHGDNVWEQYFEPVGPWSSDALQRMLADPACAGLTAGLRTVDEATRARIKTHPDSIYTWIFGHWRDAPPGDLAAWFEEQRRKGRETVRQHVRVKRHVLDEVDRFFERELAGHDVLGLHMRGTDLHYAPPVSPGEYFGPIDRYLRAHPGARIFLATDQVQYLELMEARYPGIVRRRECLRSADATAPFEMEAASPYQKGEDVLIDILLLSRCSFLIRGASNIPEMAIYFSDTLESLDLSIDKRVAFGQDYVGRWSPLAARPAWEILRHRDLAAVPDDAASQSARQRIGYELRRAWAGVRRPWRRLRRRLRRAASGLRGPAPDRGP